MGHGVAGSRDLALVRQVREVHAFLVLGIETELTKLDELLGAGLDAFNASVQAAAVPAVIVEKLGEAAGD